jgi:hypothetical protein
MALVAAMGDAFMKDNLAFDIKGMGLPLTYGNINILSEKPVWPTDFMPLPANEVVGYITRNAGARPKERDAVDKRIIQDLLIEKDRFSTARMKSVDTLNIKQHIENWMYHRKISIVG